MTTGKLILSALLGGAAYWLLDSVTDAFIFHEGAFLSLAFSPTLHESFMRGIIIVLLVVMSAVILLNRQARKAEVGLREKEKLLSESQQFAHIGSWSWEIATGGLTWTDETYRIFGRSPDTFVLSSESFLRLLHPADRSVMQEWLRACQAGEVTGDLEFRAILPDNTVRVLNGRGGLERDAENRTVRMVGTVQDITERRQAEEKLHRQRSLLDTIIESTTEAIFAKDTNGYYHTINGAGAKMLGYKATEVIGRTDRDLLPAETANEFLKTDEQVMSSGKAYEREESGVIDGRNRVFLAHKTPWRDSSGAIIGIIGVSNDITERKLAEKALQESEAKFRMVYKSLVDAIGVSRNGVHVFVNPAYCVLFGYDSSEELMERSILDLIAPEERGRIREYTQRRQQGLPVPSSYETRGLRKDGTTFSMDVHVTSYTLGTEIFTLVILRDITEAKRDQELVMVSEEKYRNLVELAHDGIIIVQDGIIKFANARMAELDGSSQEELVGTPYTAHIHPSEIPRLMDMYQRRMAGEALPTNYETLLMRKDGSPAPSELNAGVIQYNGKPADMVIIRDITERKRADEERQQLQAQLLQSQKMEAIGQLAGGVAHDFNNILSAIMGYGELARMKMSADDPLRHSIEQILESSQRAAVLTQSLLAFSRKLPIKMELLKLNSVIGKFEKFLLRLLREDIEMTTHYSPEKLLIMADRGQIEQVVMNLVTNARDAMPHGGKIKIETRRVSSSELGVRGSEPAGQSPERTGLHSELRTHDSEPADFAEISVTDTGIGMDAETQRKIFEPFFTTKELGKGTGLGLATVYGIVKIHDGFINVYSEPGKGTAFHIYIPLVHSIEIAAEPAKQEPEPLKGGMETILLAEDDASLRKMTSTVLKHMGYTVIEAENGQEAVEKFIANKDAIRLVILDGIMPRMNGKEAYHKILALVPGVRCIFMSGYAEDVFTKDGVLLDAVEFLSKPVTPSVLLNKVREVLER